ncbi:MAG: CDP-glucose 4,6-dehydratase [Lentisphaeria bacterium]|nr:CDP-glucose 4,6-dehydratase [Lentisphaeria bacterium]
MFNSVYQGKRVLLTGHTGFKGSYLASWLSRMGAEVCAVALAPESSPAHWDLLSLPVESHLVDIRELAGLQQIFTSFQPEMVFHLAAQPIVRLSYDIPVETFETNVMGTVNILECCRRAPSLRAAVIVTSDKCYENREQSAGYIESDPMGGYDPYSASKGCCELVVSSYRRSFFNTADYGRKHQLLLASARAGNVIGGGDWAKDRLVPDIMRAAAAGVAAKIRNPFATRPWQYVLEPLSGYLQLGAELFLGKCSAAGAWNFGPDADGVVSVGKAAEMLAEKWEDIKFVFDTPAEQPHEATLLQLDCSKAHEKLAWHGVLTPEEMFSFTAEWYREYYRNDRVITGEQLDRYIALAAERGLAWIN